MRLNSPEWLLCLLALPLLALVAYLIRRRRGARWQKLLAARLRGRLSQARPSWIDFTSLGLALLGLAGLIIAMAQPESGEEWIEVESEGRNILFCIDISRSMLAEDVQPNRLQASRAAALEILERFPNDRVGVLLYAGENLIQSPLTLDHGFVEQTLAQLNPADIPYGGSNLSGAIRDGVRLLSQSGQQSHLMVVFSDGENSTSGVEAAANEAAKEGIFIYALGMGTSEGSFIPDARQRDGKFRDRSGNQVFTQLNEEALQTIATRTAGFYSKGMGRTFLRKLDSALNEMDRFREEGKHQRVAKPAHQWFLLSGLIMLMLSIFVRILPLRSALPLLPFLACFFSFQSAEASLMKDGREALERGDSLAAYQFFKLAAQEESGERARRLQLAAGSAAFQAKSWEAAADSFSEALVSEDLPSQQQAHYGLATSLFYLGIPRETEERIKAWQGSVKHYEAALDLDPNDAKAAENLQRVKELLQSTEEKQKEEEENQSEQTDEAEDESEQDPQQEEQEEQEEQKEGQDGKEGEDESEKEGKGDQGNQGEEEEEKEEEEEEEPKTGDETQEQEGPEKEENEKRENSEKGESKPSPSEQKEAPNEKPAEGKEAEPLNESREERARRLLKQYADFGGKAPRRIRRPYNRSAQDW